MNNEELSRCEKKAAKYRRFRNWFLFLCIFWAVLCIYAITKWQQEIVARVEIETLYEISEQDKNHYQQQWIDTLIERNEYYWLYENCQNESELYAPWRG
jgi:hypothetical protein